MYLFIDDTLCVCVCFLILQKINISILVFTWTPTKYGTEDTVTTISFTKLAHICVGRNL